MTVERLQLRDIDDDIIDLFNKGKLSSLQDVDPIDLKFIIHTCTRLIEKCADIFIQQEDK